MIVTMMTTFVLLGLSLAFSMISSCKIKDCRLMSSLIYNKACANLVCCYNALK